MKSTKRQRNHEIQKKNKEKKFWDPQKGQENPETKNKAKKSWKPKKKQRIEIFKFKNSKKILKWIPENPIKIKEKKSLNANKAKEKKSWNPQEWQGNHEI